MKPANVTKVKIDKAGQKAAVIVAEDQLSIAIGKSGQNVRLAGKLTGYELDVEGEQGRAPAKDKEAVGETAPKEAKAKDEAAEAPKEQVESKKVVQKLKKKSELEDSLLKAIEEHGE